MEAAHFSARARAHFVSVFCRMASSQRPNGERDKRLRDNLSAASGKFYFVAGFSNKFVPFPNERQHLIRVYLDGGLRHFTVADCVL